MNAGGADLVRCSRPAFRRWNVDGQKGGCIAIGIRENAFGVRRIEMNGCEERTGHIVAGGGQSLLGFAGAARDFAARVVVLVLRFVAGLALRGGLGRIVAATAAVATGSTGAGANVHGRCDRSSG